MTLQAFVKYAHVLIYCTFLLSVFFFDFLLIGLFSCIFYTIVCLQFYFVVVSDLNAFLSGLADLYMFCMLVFLCDYVLQFCVSCMYVFCFEFFYMFVLHICPFSVHCDLNLCRCL